MQRNIDRVTEQLAKEVECYRELLEVVRAERDILLGGDHKMLMGTAEKKVKISAILGEAQAERRRAMQAFAKRPGQPVKLAELEVAVPQERRREFKQAVREAADLAKQISHMNDANKGFLEEALDTVEHLLSIITGRREGQTYNAKGMASAAPARRLMTREA